MYAAIFVSGNQVTAFIGQTEAEILSELRNWYAQNLDEERQLKPTPEIASIEDISNDYCGGCPGHFIQVRPVAPIQALTMRHSAMNQPETLTPDLALIRQRLNNLSTISQELQPTQAATEFFDSLIEKGSRNPLEQQTYKQLGSFLCGVEHLNLAIAYFQQMLGEED